MLRSTLSVFTTLALTIALCACQSEASPPSDDTSSSDTTAVEASATPAAPTSQPVAAKARGTTPADEQASFNFAPDGPISDEQLGDYYVEMSVKVGGQDVGTMEIGFWPEKAPNHVRNFLRYTATGFYDGLIFHRIIREFMVQAGQDTSGERPQWGNVNAEFSTDPEYSHLYGVLSAARLGNDVNSATSQFFIVCADSPHLDGQYSSFGKLTKGVKTLEALANAKTVQGSPENSMPMQPIEITKAVVKQGKPTGGETIERPLPDEPPIVRVQHVLVSFKEIERIGATRTKEEAETLAKDILERAKRGDDFTAMVREHSDDPNSAEDPSPGTYRLVQGWYRDEAFQQEQQAMMEAAQKQAMEFQQGLQAKLSAGEIDQAEAQKQNGEFLETLRMTDLKDMASPRGQMVKGFGDVAFELEVGEVGIANFDQNDSPFGWHIIKRVE